MAALAVGVSTDAEAFKIGYRGIPIVVKDFPAVHEAITELEALRQLLPLCAWCKEIRGNDGNWTPIDQYVAEHYCEITHSICPGCSQKHFAKHQV